jgi:hypothetical protein
MNFESMQYLFDFLIIGMGIGYLMNFYFSGSKYIGIGIGALGILMFIFDLSHNRREKMCEEICPLKEENVEDKNGVENADDLVNKQE